MSDLYHAECLVCGGPLQTDGQCPGCDRYEIIPAKHQVIEDRLLTALNDDDGVVAVLYSKEDLDILIEALEKYLRWASASHLDAPFASLREMLSSLRQLKQAAFP